MKFEDALKSRTLVSDGAMGTSLQENGLTAGHCPEEMIDIMEEFKEHTDLPLLAQANAGLPDTKDGKMIYNETLEQRSKLARKLLNKNVNIIGGCCGTNPNHIQAIRNVVDKYSSLK